MSRLNFDSFSSFLTKYLIRLTPQVVGTSGLAVLCSASLLALAPVTGQNMAYAITTYLGGLGLNVLAGVLQNFYQILASQPTDDDLKHVQRLTELLAKKMREYPKLRQEIGIFLNKQRSLQIAMEVVKGNPATHGWLLWRIYEDGTEHKTQLADVQQSLIEIKKLIEELSGHSYFPSRISNVQEYMSELEKEVSLLNLPGIPNIPDGIQPMFEEIYVSQQLSTQRPLHRGTYTEFLSEQNLWVSDTAGTGKSTFLKRVLFDWCKDSSGSEMPTVIPIPLHANQIDFRFNKPFIEYVIELVVKQRGLSNYVQRSINDAFLRGKTVLLIDGLDEVPLDKQLSISKALLGVSAQQNKTRIILASRPIENIGIAYTKAEISRFDLNYASFLVHKWRNYFAQQGILNIHNNERKLTALEDSLNTAFKDSGVANIILQNPLYLTYLIFYTVSPYEYEREDTTRLIRSKASLIKKTVTHVIPYWEKNKNGRVLGQDGLPSKTIALKLLWLTGFLLKKHPFSSRDDILFDLEKELKTFFPGQSPSTLENGFSYWQDSNVLRVSEMDNTVSFWHTEIGDYCAAEYMNDPHGFKTISIDKELRQVIQTDPHWENVKRFYRTLPKERK